MADWYKSDVDHVVNSLSTSLKAGLSDEEAKQRLHQYGLNELIESHGCYPTGSRGCFGCPG